MSLFTRLPVTCPDATTFLAEVDVMPITDLETDAWEHWLLGPDSGTLTGLVNGRALTPQSDPPAYAANYASVVMDDGKALLSSLVPSAGETITMAAVLNVPVAPSTVAFILGNRVLQTGISLWCSSTGVLTSGFAGGIANITPKIVFGSWHYLAVTWRIGDTTDNVSAYAGGLGYSTHDNPQAENANAINATGIGIGNPGYVASVTQAVRVADLAMWRGDKTEAQLAALYARAAARAAVRGISISPMVV